MRQWRVAGGLLIDERGLLLVANRRRGGVIDWTTPGGVVDAGETPVEALSREVSEETGLIVAGWERLCWTVAVEFVELEMLLDVEVYLATGFDGNLMLEDPDGIVVAAEFLDTAEVTSRLVASPLWVSEPMQAWTSGAWSESRHFSYAAYGSDPNDMRAERLSE